MSQPQEHMEEMNKLSNEAIQKRVAKQKELFLKVYAESLGLVFETCKKVGIAARTFENWKQKDVQFAMRCENVSLEQKNYIEGELLEAIKGGDQQNIRFWLKCKHPEYGTKIGLNLDDVITKVSIEIIKPAQEDANGNIQKNKGDEKESSFQKDEGKTTQENNVQSV